MFDLRNEDGTPMLMTGSNGGRVMAVMSGDLSEDEDGEEDDVISLLVHDGELYHLENEPFTGKFYEVG